MWLEHAQCKEIVERGWRTVENNTPFSDCTKSCSENLKSWDSVVFGGIRKKINLLKERIQKLQSLNPETHVLNSIKECGEELDDLLKKEEIMWFQRSRALWLKEGDRNTPFFHLKATQMRDRNTIHRLETADGEWTTEVGEIGAVLRDYYSELFTSVDHCNMHLVLETVETKVTGEMNEFLT
ncbi:hypothetical protein ACS0TY_011147 [Phlomoides rotata]